MPAFALGQDTRPPSGVSAAERIAQLRSEITRHDELYFKNAEPEITDAEYDLLKRTLADLERNYPDQARTSHTPPAISDDRTGRFPSHSHAAPMLGLAKVYTDEELAASIERMTQGSATAELIIEPKLDGVALSVIYEQGQLTRALTRGNGQIGEEVTANAMRIANLPHALTTSNSAEAPQPIPRLVELRGEVVISKTDFAAYNREREATGDTVFAHPRNFAAGSLKLDDPEEVANRPLQIILYGIGAWESTAPPPATQTALLQQITAWGLPAIKPLGRTFHPNEVLPLIHRFAKERAAFSFPTDGVVIKLDSAAAQRRLGLGPEAPRWAVAWKYSPERTTATLRDVVFQVGRTGRITPLANLEPTSLAGSTVRRVNLYNRANVTRLDLHQGDTVRLERTGEVVPTIVAAEPIRRPVNALAIEFPVSCPECTTPLATLDREPDPGCPNRNCPARVRGALIYFCKTMDIKGLGEKTADALIKTMNVRNVADLYRLNAKTLEKVRGLGPQKAASLLAEINFSRNKDLGTFLAALGIAGINRKAASEVEYKLRNLNNLLIKTQSDFGSESIQIPSELKIYMKQIENRAVIKQLLALGFNPKAHSPNSLSRQVR